MDIEHSPIEGRGMAISRHENPPNSILDMTIISEFNLASQMAVEYLGEVSICGNPMPGLRRKI